MNLGDRLRELRGLQGHTLKDVSDITGLSVSYLSDIERNRTTPSLESLRTLALSFNISITDLLSGVDIAGEATQAGLPPGLADLIADTPFGVSIDQEWINLLRKIELRGKRPDTKEEWYELFLALRRILDAGQKT